MLDLHRAIARSIDRFRFMGKTAPVARIMRSARGGSDSGGGGSRAARYLINTLGLYMDSSCASLRKALNNLGNISMKWSQQGSSNFQGNPKVPVTLRGPRSA
eukprot:3184249-Pleurochrysis_carterae.AAC.4